jgi:hypothetical protein
MVAASSRVRLRLSSTAVTSKASKSSASASGLAVISVGRRCERATCPDLSSAAAGRRSRSPMSASRGVASS